MARRIRFLAVAILAIAALLAPSTRATITDDINPLGIVAQLLLQNTGVENVSGTATVTVTVLGGGTEVRTKSFSVVAGGETQVNFLFTSPIVEVIAVEITEGPDPIP